MGEPMLTAGSARKSPMEETSSKKAVVVVAPAEEGDLALTFSVAEEGEKTNMGPAHTVYDDYVGREDSRLVVLAIVACSLPFLPGISATLGLIQPALMWLMDLDELVRLILPITTVVLVIICVCCRDNVSWAQVHIGLFCIWLAALPATAEYYIIPFLVVLLLFPMVGFLVSLATANKIKVFRAVMWAGLLWSAFMFFFLARATGVHEVAGPREFTESSGSSCPVDFAYVSNAGLCRMYARQEGIDVSFPKSGAPQCCLRTGDEVHMMLGRCDLSMIADNNESQFACLFLNQDTLGFQGGDTWADFRRYIQNKHFDVDELGEVRCAFGNQNRLLAKQTAAQKAACDDLEKFGGYAALYMFMLPFLYFVFAWLAWLRRDYLTYASMGTGSADSWMEWIFRISCLIVFIWLFVGMLQNITFIQDETGNAGPFLYLCLVVLMFSMTAAPVVKVQPSDVKYVMLRPFFSVGQLFVRIYEWRLFDKFPVQVLCFLFFWPVFPILYLLGACGPCSSTLTTGYLGIRKWEWTSLLSTAGTVGIVILLYRFITGDVTLIAASQLTTLIENLPYPLIVFIWISFGVFALLVPGVPSLVFYLGTGPATFPPALKAGIDPTLAFVICCCIGMAGKLGGTIAQNIVGRYAGESIKVRFTIGMHKPMMRAFGIMIMQDGFQLNKVVAISFGPDFPIGVLMGMLGMSFGAACLWTLPSMIQVVPLVFAGVFAGRQGPMGDLTDTVRTCGMILNISMTLAALNYGARAVELYKEEVMVPRPSLKVLEEMQEVADKEAEVAAAKVEWNGLAIHAKFFMYVAACCLSSGALPFLTSKSSVFNPFDSLVGFDGPLEEGGLEGNFWNVFTDYGQQCLSVFGIGVLCKLILNCCIVPRLPEREPVPKVEMVALGSDAAMVDKSTTV